MKRLWDRFVLWLYSTLFVWFVGLYLGLKRRRKMSHNNGVAGAGTVRVVDDQAFPPHPFFAPGKTFGCRVRHASAGFLDDGMMLVRSLSVKFADAPVESPLDLELNNGRSLFWTARNFLSFAFGRKNDRGLCYLEWYKEHEPGRAAAQDSLAKLPDTYHTLEYTSQTPTWWVGADGVKRYACYRIVPHEDPVQPLGASEAEIGRFTGNQQVDEADPRDRNYLKREWMARVQAGAVRYRIQVQTREPDDDPEICNSNVRWDAAKFPWRDLAVITVERVIPYHEEQLMWFSLAHAPEGLGILPATSVDDPNSLNYMRVKSDLAKRLRVWATRRRGAWPNIPSEGPRNVDEFNAEELLYPTGLEAAEAEQAKAEATLGAGS